MKNLQLQKASLYILGIMLSIISGCSSQPETNGSATDKVANSGLNRDNGNSTNPVPKKPLITSYEDNFIGEWKSVQSEGRDHTIITRNGKNFLIQQGKKSVPGIWDEENKIIRLNVGVPIDIMYIENEDMIVFGSGGKYRRVSEKL